MVVLAQLFLGHAVQVLARECAEEEVALESAPFAGLVDEPGAEGGERFVDPGQTGGYCGVLRCRRRRRGR